MLLLDVPPEILQRAILAYVIDVRVRWVDHKCKVNSDEFDEEESYLRVKQV